MSGGWILDFPTPADLSVTRTFRVDTPRLQIREWQPHDRPGLQRLTDDAEMMRYITAGEPWSTARIDGMFDRQAASLHNTGLCVGAVFLRETGELIGIAGAQPLDRLDGFDLAWWIWREHWGRGLATEAAAAVCRHALQHGLPRVYACIDPDNQASLGVARNIGMRPAGRCRADQTASWRPPTDVLLFVAGADPLSP